MPPPWTRWNGSCTPRATGPARPGPARGIPHGEGAAAETSATAGRAPSGGRRPAGTCGQVSGVQAPSGRWLPSGFARRVPSGGCRRAVASGRVPAGGRVRAGAGRRARAGRCRPAGALGRVSPGGHLRAGVAGAGAFGPAASVRFRPAGALGRVSRVQAPQGRKASTITTISTKYTTVLIANHSRSSMPAGRLPAVRSWPRSGRNLPSLPKAFSG